MTEIVVEIASSGILHIEILIPLGHRMALGDMSYYMDVLCYGAGLSCQDKSVIVNLRPLRSNTMEISALGIKLTTHCIRREDDFCFVINLHEML